MLIYSILYKRYTDPSRRRASCKISYFSLTGVHYDRYTCILFDIDRGKSIPMIQRRMPL